MGKRELLLIGAFILVGAAVYYATAPPAASGEHGFSISKVLDHVRREMRGNRATAEVKKSAEVNVARGVTELRLEIGGTPVTVVGEDRPDVACELTVQARGYDEAEANARAAETNLKISEGGSSLTVGVAYPEQGNSRATLAIRVPATLNLRVQPSRGKVEISNVASADLVESRGQVIVRDVRGRLTITHRSGTLLVENAPSLRLNARGGSITAKGISGEAQIVVQSGEFKGSGLVGPIDVESNGARVLLEDLSATKQRVKVNAMGGFVSLVGVHTDTRVDARDARVEVKIAEPAPIAVYADANASMDITLPARGGYTLDAIASDGKLTLPDGMKDRKGVESSSTGDEQRARATIDGGGPAITLRASRGTIVVKEAAPASGTRH